MALFYRSTTSHTSNYGGSNNSDPTIHTAEWMSYQVTDWVNRIGPSFATIKYNHEDWDAHGGYTTTSNVQLQLGLRGADYRAANDSGLDHGMFWQMGGDTNGYLYWYTSNFQDNRYAGGSGGGPGSWITTSSRSVFSNRYHLRPSAYTSPRLAQVMFSDTPGQRFFAWDLYGQRGVIYEGVNMSNIGTGVDPGWHYIYSTLTGICSRLASDTALPNYYGTYTQINQTYIVGNTNTSTYRGVRDKLALRDYFGRYLATTSNVAFVQYALPVGWRWQTEDRTFVSWDSYYLVEITGLVDG